MQLLIGDKRFQLVTYGAPLPALIPPSVDGYGWVDKDGGVHLLDADGNSIGRPDESTAVDVLAVMDRAANGMENVIVSEDHYFELSHPAEMRAARAAVAKLLEADKEYDAAREAMEMISTDHPLWPPHRDRFVCAKKGREEAMARCAPDKP